MATQVWLGKWAPAPLYAAAVLCSGCGGTGSVAFAPAVPASKIMAPAEKAFGVALGNDAGAEGTGGSKGMSWTFDWCNGAPGNVSGCYFEVSGKRKFVDIASGTANLFYGSKSVGYTKAKISGTQKIGTAGYVMSAEQNGTTATGTISTAVGDSYPIYFATSGQVNACTGGTQCIGDYFAVLSGSDKFKITSITTGATYTTASGVTYE